MVPAVTHTIKKKHQQKAREQLKTFYASYEDTESNEPQINALDLLPAIRKHIKSELIEVSY